MKRSTFVELFTRKESRRKSVWHIDTEILCSYLYHLFFHTEEITSITAKARAQMMNWLHCRDGRSFWSKNLRSCDSDINWIMGAFTAFHIAYHESRFFANLIKYWIFLHRSFRDSVPLTIIVGDPGLVRVLTNLYSVHLFAQVAVTARARSLLLGSCTIKQSIRRPFLETSSDFFTDR